MSQLPENLKLSAHARKRLEERKDESIRYNTHNLMRSSVKWYTKNDLIHDCALYRHCCYTTRDSKQRGYITDGDIEIIYSKKSHKVITVLEVKDKFKPIEQFINPKLLKKLLNNNKKKKVKEKENTEMKTELKPNNNTCIDCGKEAELNKKGVCVKCFRRKANMKARGKEYIPYLQLPPEEKQKIDYLQKVHSKQNEKVKIEENEKIIRPQQNKLNIHEFITLLQEYGCEISPSNLESVLKVLLNIDALKDLFLKMMKNDNQQAMLDLSKSLYTIEGQLQNDWEINEFQEEYDKKFKNFIMWRKFLKNNLLFWEKLYKTNTLSELQSVWGVDTTTVKQQDVKSNTMKKFQISTESFSPTFNTSRPFSRVFFATDKYMAEKNLQENPEKTSIIELNNNK